MDTTFPLNSQMRFAGSDEPDDVLDAFVLGPFLDGSLPHAQTVHLSAPLAEAPLAPHGSTPVRSARGRWRRVWLHQGEGWVLRATRWQDGSATLTVVAADEPTAVAILAAATDGAEAPPPPPDEAVPMAFWNRDQRPVRRVRSIGVSPWPSVRQNYGAREAAALERLMGLQRSDVTGRLVLLHGPPGTGKTSALRALAHAWRPWCRTEVVIDPEALFAQPSYLLSVAIHELDEDDDGAVSDGPGDFVARRDETPRRFRLLVLEDCDELIRGDAKRGAGQALGRLLNITDGLVGQGLDVLVAITTNEPIGRLHPAIVRPGRCLAQIEVGRLSPAEAAAWMGAPIDVGPEGATLAELVARRDGTEPLEDAPAHAGHPGQYL